MFNLFLITTIIFGILVVVEAYFLWKFAKIIMIFEDDLSEAIEATNAVEDAIKQVLEMQMFFDSPEVKQATQNILEQVKICRIIIQKVIGRFTQRSKRQYITLWDIEEDDHEDGWDEEYIPKLPGQPPGTPNPMELIYGEGTVLNVGRTKRKQR